MFNWQVLLNVFYIPSSYRSSIRFSTDSLFFLELITISIWSLRHFLMLHNESFIKISLSLYTLGTCVRSVISSWYTFAFLPVLVSKMCVIVAFREWLVLSSFIPYSRVIINDSPLTTLLYSCLLIISIIIPPH